MHAITSMGGMLGWMYRYIMRGTEGGRSSRDACMRSDRHAWVPSNPGSLLPALEFMRCGFKLSWRFGYLKIVLSN